MGKVIHAYRHHPYHGRRAVSQETVAAWLSITQPQLSRIETGAPIAHLDRLVHCAMVLGIPQRWLWFALPETSPNVAAQSNWHWTADQRPQPGAVPTPGRDLVAEPFEQRWTPHHAQNGNDVKRRDLLRLGGLIISGRVLELLDFEPDRMRAALDSTSVSEDRLVYYEKLADTLGYDVVKIPPAELLEMTTTSFCSVRRLIEERQRTQHQTRLVVVAAKLATVVGEILFNVGELDAARQWYLTAMDASREAGHQYLRDIALAGMAYLPTYSDDPEGVLSVVTNRLDQAPPPTPAIAWLWGAAARAQASIGDQLGFKRSISTCQAVLSESDPDLIRPGIFSFLPEKQAFYEADGYARLRDLERNTEAANRALSIYDENEIMEPALVQIDHAMALVGAGEVEEGCRIATVAITHPKTFVGLTVANRSGQLDRLLNGSKLPAVKDWRENLSLVMTRRSNDLTVAVAACDTPLPEAELWA
jgi:hypothetical protein